MPDRMWDEITNPFPNLNGATVQVWKWIGYFIPHNLMGVINYSSKLGTKFIHVNKMGPRNRIYYYPLWFILPGWMFVVLTYFHSIKLVCDICIVFLWARRQCKTEMKYRIDWTSKPLSSCWLRSRGLDEEGQMGPILFASQYNKQMNVHAWVANGVTTSKTLGVINVHDYAQTLSITHNSFTIACERIACHDWLVY